MVVITSSGNLYVIHAGVSIARRGDSITLTKHDRTITTSDLEFVAGVLAAAERQGIPVNAEEPPHEPGGPRGGWDVDSDDRAGEVLPVGAV